MKNLYVIDGVKLVFEQNSKTGYWKAEIRASVSGGVFLPSEWLLRGGYTDFLHILEDARVSVPLHRRALKLEPTRRSRASIQAALIKAETEFDWSLANRLAAYSEAEASVIFGKELAEKGMGGYSLN